MQRILMILWMMLAATGGVQAQTHHRRHHAPVPYKATAYSHGSTTSSGTDVHSGQVAADTRILPIGTTIQVQNAGAYSGIYTVTDTGAAIRGRRIDIYIPNRLRAKTFGTKIVLVRVLHRGTPPTEMSRLSR